MPAVIVNNAGTRVIQHSFVLAPEESSGCWRNQGFQFCDAYAFDFRVGYERAGRNSCTETHDKYIASAGTDKRGDMSGYSLEAHIVSGIGSFYISININNAEAGLICDHN